MVIKTDLTSRILTTTPLIVLEDLPFLNNVSVPSLPAATKLSESLGEQENQY